MLYSVRMRSALTGRHISGAERLVPQEKVAETAEAMLQRAFRHSKGQPDVCNITIEAIAESEIVEVALLPVSNIVTHSLAESRQRALELLRLAGVTVKAAQTGMGLLTSLQESMRGAMLICAVTGKRLDRLGMRGLRVSRMDIADEEAYQQFITSRGLAGIHVQEAMVLAAKVAAASGVIAELCWSDDPEYTTGYIASNTLGYIRLPHCKPSGSTLGGRIFFVKDQTPLEALVQYLQQQPVKVVAQEGKERRHGAVCR